MKNEVKVGMFVTVALIIFVVTFLSVANVQLAGKKFPYRTYFRFAGGLDSGTIVRYAGLKAGVVTGVRAWEEDPTQVEVRVSIRENIRVNEDSVARVASLSALGQNYLEISPGSLEAPTIEPGGVIPSEESVTINDILNKISSLSTKAEVVLEDVSQNFEMVSQDAHVLLGNLNKMTAEKNQKNLESLLANANKLIEQQGPKIDRITTQISSTLDKVDGLAVDLRELANNTNDTVVNVDRTVDELREPLKRDLIEVEKTLVEARQLMEDIQSVVVINEDNITNMIANFERASRDIEGLARELRQRPWTLIRVKPKKERDVPLASR